MRVSQRSGAITSNRWERHAQGALMCAALAPPLSLFPRLQLLPARPHIQLGRRAVAGVQCFCLLRLLSCVSAHLLSAFDGPRATASAIFIIIIFFFSSPESPMGAICQFHLPSSILSSPPCRHGWLRANVLYVAAYGYLISERRGPLKWGAHLLGGVAFLLGFSCSLRAHSLVRRPPASR